MGICYATVVEGSAGRPFGIVTIDGQDLRLQIQIQDNARLARYVDPPQSLCLVRRPHHSSPLNAGDRLTVLMSGSRQGQGKIDLWVSREQWDTAMGFDPHDSTPPPEAPAPVPTSEPPAASAQVAEPVVSPVLPSSPEQSESRAEEVYDFADIAKKLGEPFATAVASSLKKAELTLKQLHNFADNTPKGKRGKALMAEYEKRRSKSRSKHYGIAAFVHEALEDQGFLVAV